MEAIKDQLMEIVYGPGVNLHGEVYTFKLVLGGDMAFQEAVMAHAMGKEYGLEEPYLCPGCGETIQRHGDFPPDDKDNMQNYQWVHFG
eukprot:jgi/Tetstr1/445453/TSEL_033232.t1